MDDDLNRMLINPLPTVRAKRSVRGRGRQAGRREGEREPTRQSCAGLSPCAPRPPHRRPPLRAWGALQGVKLHAIIDACHSGSVMDLPFQVLGSYWSVHTCVCVCEHGCSTLAEHSAYRLPRTTALRLPLPHPAGARAGRVRAVGKHVSLHSHTQGGQKGRWSGPVCGQPCKRHECPPSPALHSAHSSPLAGHQRRLCGAVWRVKGLSDRGRHAGAGRWASAVRRPLGATLRWRTLLAAPPAPSLNAASCWLSCLLLRLAGNASTGAATYCFIQAIERRGLNLTYGELLLAMHHTLQATSKLGQAVVEGVRRQGRILPQGSLWVPHPCPPVLNHPPLNRSGRRVAGRRAGRRRPAGHAAGRQHDERRRRLPRPGAGAVGQLRVRSLAQLQLMTNCFFTPCWIGQGRAETQGQAGTQGRGRQAGAGRNTRAGQTGRRRQEHKGGADRQAQAGTQGRGRQAGAGRNTRASRVTRGRHQGERRRCRMRAAPPRCTCADRRFVYCSIP